MQLEMGCCATISIHLEGPNDFNEEAGPKMARRVPRHLIVDDS